MIRSEADYREAVKRVSQEKRRLAEQVDALEGMGLSPEQIKRATDPMRSFQCQLEEEIASYERLKRGEFEKISNLRGFGHLLISLRIARGISQRELAKRVGVNEAQVSRDERNEYRGITLDRASRILDVLGYTVLSRVEAVQPQASN